MAMNGRQKLADVGLWHLADMTTTLGHLRFLARCHCPATRRISTGPERSIPTGRIVLPRNY
jgi:hypothetical protein